MTDFINLHNQTEFSILDSIIEPKELFLRAKELNQKAVAITDHGTLAAIWTAYKASQATGVKLIAGCECYFVNDVSNPEEKFRHIIFLAKNALGYRNLLTLNKKGFDQGISIGKKIYPIIDWKLLGKYNEGLICLTACGNGILSQLISNGQLEEAEKTLLKLGGLFGPNLGIEVQANNMKRGSNIYNDQIDQQFLNRQLINLGKKYNIKIVPTCNAHYLKKEEAEVHDLLLTIGSRQSVYSNFRLKYPSSEFYLKSGEEVKNFFARNYGEELAEEMCANTLYFANLCEQPNWINPKFSNPSGKELPIFPIKDEQDYLPFLNWKSQQSDDLQKLDDDKLYLRYRCLQAFDFLKLKDKRYIEKEQEYLDRINEEFDVLEYQGFSSYLLIVADYVSWCKKNSIPAGPGRGSVGGCFLAFLLGIHNADSLKYDLIFARFQNKYRTQYPDIDQDVSTRFRDKVLSYLKNKYGSDNFCAISNYNTITPKVYMRDIARSFELNGKDYVATGDMLSEAVSNEAKNSGDINYILKTSPLLGEYCKKYPEIVKYSKILSKPRARSIHAAGVVIGQRPLVGLTPLTLDKDNVWAIEYDKDITEENGFVKMDILGLSTLDDIQDVINLIKRSGKPFNDEHLNYDANDEKTYELISRGDTFKVFQLGTSAGTIDLCKKIQPKNLDDLAIITTLARPAAANIRQDFIDTRAGNKPYTLLHPSLKGAFEKTFGYGLYDESILRLGTDVAGWDLNASDRIRKMIKDKGKNPEKDKKLREEFIQDSVKNGLDLETATNIWDNEIKKFAGYTFNKSHAIVYSMLSYQTAYLKAHYPIEFLLANLISEVESNALDADKNINKLKQELRNHNITFMPPDLNKSDLSFKLIDGNKLLTGLNSLKFVGDEAIKDILNKRPFSSFFDFMSRVDSSKVRANNIQALAASGALDSFSLSRKDVFLYCSDYRKKLQVWLKRHNPSEEEFVYPWVKEDNWSLSELYALENHYLGEAFICPPSKAYGSFFKDEHYTVNRLKNFSDRAQISSFKGIVRDVFEFRVKKEGSRYLGQSMIKMLIEDKHGNQCGCTIFPDRWKIIQKRIKDINSKITLEPGVALHFSGSINYYENEMNIIIDQLYNILSFPSLPSDKKHRKVSLKSNKEFLKDPKNLEGLKEEIEEALINMGLVNLEENY